MPLQTSFDKIYTPEQLELREVEAPAETSPLSLHVTALDMPDPSNRKPTHGILRFNNQPTVIFDTICTKHRLPWLADEDVHQLLRQVWADAKHWLVGKYVLMPDHIHLFAWETEQSRDYESWTRYWKSQFSKRHGNHDHRWQADHWETRIRNANAYEEKWNYIRQNPVRHELVEAPEDWPYQGELFQLEWT